MDSGCGAIWICRPTSNKPHAASNVFDWLNKIIYVQYNTYAVCITYMLHQMTLSCCSDVLKKFCAYLLYSYELYCWYISYIVGMGWGHFITISLNCMMALSDKNIFRVTDPFWGKYTGRCSIPLTEASDVEHWWYLWSEPEQKVEQVIETLVICDAIAPIMTSL